MLKTKMDFAKHIVEHGGCYLWGQHHYAISCYGNDDYDTINVKPCPFLLSCNKYKCYKTCVARAKEYIKEQEMAKYYVEFDEFQEYKENTLFRKKDNGSLWYFKGFNKVDMKLSHNKEDSKIDSFVYRDFFKEEFEQVFLQHPMYGKKVEVKQRYDSVWTKRILVLAIDNGGCICVEGTKAEAFYAGDKYSTCEWDEWREIRPAPKLKSVTFKMTDSEIERVRKVLKEARDK